MSFLTYKAEPLSTSHRVLCGAVLGFILLLAIVPVSPVHAGYTAFMTVALACAWILSRGTLEGIRIERIHRPRVFEGDRVPVTLVVRQNAGLAQSLIVVDDQFFAALATRKRLMVPMMSVRWEARLHYTQEAERHRGLYFLGPVRLWGADPLGIFARTTETDCVTHLTVYPRAAPLGGYRFLGPHPFPGPTLETWSRVGQGEEIISIRPYQPGDPPGRIHWRTSARRGQLHTIELDTHVQTEVAILMDLTRLSKYGTGMEATTEVAAGCATSILSEASTLRHWISLTWVRDRVEMFPRGQGLAHLHMLLDRLAVVTVAGELDFWQEIAPRAAMLAPGSRAVFIVVAAQTPAEEACALVGRLTLRGVAVDVILIDESKMTRIWRDQDPTLAKAAQLYAALRLALERAGARVFPLSRGEDVSKLMPRAQEEER